jgi:hypothetical protein
MNYVQTNLELNIIILFAILAACWGIRGVTTHFLVSDVNISKIVEVYHLIARILVHF